MVPAMVGARFAYLAAFAAAVVLLKACAGGVPSEERAEWRDRAEAACMASGRVRASPYVQSAGSVNGPSACSIRAGLKVSGALGGRVGIKPPATIGCPMTASLDRWIHNSVQRAAQRQFGRQVVEIRQIASYSCRGRNGRRRGPLSEHAYGNAIDIAGFRLSDGREITVVKGWWRGSAREKAFLKEVFAGACDEFYTVLGPGSDRHHYNHFHLDLLVTNAAKGRHYCSPRPSRGLFAAVEGDPQPTASIELIPFTGPRGDH